MAEVCVCVCLSVQTKESLEGETMGKKNQKKKNKLIQVLAEIHDNKLSI